MSNDDCSYFQYFSGCVPDGVMFQMTANDIKAISKSEHPDTHSCLKNLCLIGLVSYFEAFVKDHLSAVLSIAPELIGTLREAGCQTDIPAMEAYEFRDSLKYQIGFLVGQRLDLGSGKKINSVFTKALQITPFGGEDLSLYDRLLRDRNLLVHHGGTYTTAYIKQAFSEIPSERRRAHMDSLQVTDERLNKEIDFLTRVAKSTITLSAERLEIFLSQKRTTLTKEVRGALSIMSAWEDNDEEK